MNVIVIIMVAVLFVLIICMATLAVIWALRREQQALGGEEENKLDAGYGIERLDVGTFAITPDRALLREVFDYPADDDVMYVVRNKEGEPLAALTVQTEPGMPPLVKCLAPSDGLWVAHLTTLPAAARKGLATKLITFVTGERGPLYLAAWMDDPAMRPNNVRKKFYNKLVERSVVREIGRVHVRGEFGGDWRVYGT